MRVAFKLGLSKDAPSTGAHNKFRTDLLKRLYLDSFNRELELQPAVKLENGSEEYEVEMIMDKE